MTRKTTRRLKNAEIIKISRWMEANQEWLGSGVSRRTVVNRISDELDIVASEASIVPLAKDAGVTLQLKGKSGGGGAFIKRLNDKVARLAFINLQIFNVMRQLGEQDCIADLDAEWLNEEAAKHDPAAGTETR